MRKHVEWLFRELEGWVADGILRPEQAAALRGRYAAMAHPGRAWGVILFGAFGAVVAGLGVILLFAYNWQDMPKAAKLGTVFASLLLAHGAGLELRRRGRQPALADAVQLLGTMMFGAGIWLVAQIYHISAHYPNAFFIWAAGALLFAWLLPSVSHGVLASILLALWASTEAASFSQSLLTPPLLILLGGGLLAWRQRSPTLLVAAQLAFVAALVASIRDAWLVWPTLLALAAAWLAGGTLAELRSPHFPLGGKVLRTLGFILAVAALFPLTFRDAMRHWSPPDWFVPGEGARTLWFFLPLAAGLGLAAVAAARAITARDWFSASSLRAAWLPLAMLAAYAGTFIHRELVGETGFDLLWSGLFSLVYLGFAGMLFRRGIGEGRFAPMTGGALLLGAWVFARYCDWFESLLARGLAFLLLGAALFSLALLVARSRRQLQPAPETTVN
ncbi:MAG: DUF2157 domain-containing protein [Lentisphaeria bacterium]|jgi:uncharacterized membrane protein